MKVRYFIKRGSIWIDFKLPDGSRKRIPTGVPEGQDKAAEKAAAGLVSQALAAAALPKAPSSPTVAKPVTSGWTLQRAYSTGLRTREKWMQAKDRKGLDQKFAALVDHWGADSDLAGCTRAAVQAWREEMMQSEGKREGSTLSSSTINHRLSMLSVLLEVADLPPHTVKHLSTKGNRRKRRTREEELQAVISWLITHRDAKTKEALKGALSFADLIQVALETTARQGELRALLWPDVYFDRRMVCFRDPKNGEFREVPMTEAVVLILQRRLGYGMTGPFADLSKDRCTDLWASARRAIGLEHDHEFVFHVGTRHEGLSRMGENNASSFLIKAMAGHKSVTTSEGYVKVGGEALREHAERIATARKAPDNA